MSSNYVLFEKNLTPSNCNCIVQVLPKTGYGRRDGTIKKAKVSNGQEGFFDLYAELIKHPHQSTPFNWLIYSTRTFHINYKLQEITIIFGGKGP